MTRLRYEVRRRFWLLVHDVVAHPLCGALKIVGLERPAYWLHELTLPPLPWRDAEVLPTPRGVST